MKIVFGVCATLTLGCSWSTAAFANVAVFGVPERSIGDDAVALRVGMDPVPLLELGYTRSRFGRGPAGAVVDAGFAVALPPLAGGGDFRIGAGLGPRFSLSEHVALNLGAVGFWQRAEDDAASFQSFGFELGVNPRYRARAFFVGLPLRLRASALCYVTNKAYMRAAFSDRYNHGATNDPGAGREQGPRDGAYAFTALRVFVGPELGVVLERWAFQASVGSWWTPQAQGLFASVETGQVPFYASLDVRRGF